jgi:hypothetical protein
VEFVEHAYLEAALLVALLVACGYGIEDVKTWMGRLGRRGKLKRKAVEEWWHDVHYWDICGGTW